MMKKILAALTLIALLLAVTPVQAQEPDWATAEISGEARAGVGVEANANVATESGVSFAQAASCTLHIGGFIAGNTVAIAKLRKVGGIVKTAKRLLNAKSHLGKYQIVAAVFGEAIGIEDMVSHCS